MCVFHTSLVVIISDFLGCVKFQPMSINFGVQYLKKWQSQESLGYPSPSLSSFNIVEKFSIPNSGWWVHTGGTIISHQFLNTNQEKLLVSSMRKNHLAWSKWVKPHNLRLNQFWWGGEAATNLITLEDPMAQPNETGKCQKQWNLGLKLLESSAD